MSLLAAAKNKITNDNIMEAFTNEHGAIDLASIMVGIIVIGLIGGVIAATVFAVIPWAQDNSAKQQLDSVAAAQSAYIGLSADKGDSRFGGGAISATTTAGVTTYTYTKNTVVGGDVTVTEKLFDAPTVNKVAVGMWGTAQFGGAHYVAAAKSASGKTFYVTDAKTQPTVVVPASFPDVATSELGVVVNSVKNL